MEREDKRGIFFGVIGVLTLIVAIIGASLAYFSINARSDDDAVIVQAATVQIVYDDGDEVAITNIIPTSKAVALETVRRAGQSYTDEVLGPSTYERCVDDNGRVVCGVYDFTLTNSGEKPIDVTARIVPTVETVVEGTDTTGGEETTTTRQFKNLKYMVYDITNASGINDNGTEISEGEFSYTGEFKIVDDSKKITLPGNSVTKKYRLFVWLNETRGPQNDEQGAVFKGTVFIDVPGTSGEITGNANSTLGQQNNG